MFQVEGKQLFAYHSGTKQGPFDLSGLLALISSSDSGASGGGARRRALLQGSGSPAAGIASLAFDGTMLWVVLTTG